MKTSWVIRSIETNEVLFETWQANLVSKLNKSKYYAQPIINYLSSLSQSNGKWGRDENDNV